MSFVQKNEICTRAFRALSVPVVSGTRQVPMKAGLQILDCRLEDLKSMIVGTFFSDETYVHMHLYVVFEKKPDLN